MNEWVYEEPRAHSFLCDCHPCQRLPPPLVPAPQSLILEARPPPLPTCVFSNSQRVANPLPWLQPAPPARLIPPSHLIIILSTFNESFSSPSPTQALADYCNLFDSQGIHQEGGKGPGASFPFQKLSFLSCKLGMP